MAELYKGIAGSPITQLVGDITDTQVTIAIADDSALPDAPNLCTIGFGENIETIRYGAKSNGVLSDVTRGIEGTPRAWQSGTEVARFFTAHDHNAIIAELEDARLSDVKEKTFDDLKGRLEEIEQDHDTHLAENVRQVGGVHGLEVENGGFTPTLTTSNGDMSGVSYNTRLGTYVKINDMVWFKIVLSIDGISNKGTGSVQVTGLPFIAEGGSNLSNATPCSISFFSLAASSGVNARGATLNAYVRLITGAGSMPVSELGTNGLLTISGIYKIS